MNEIAQKIDKLHAYKQLWVQSGSTSLSVLEKQLLLELINDIKQALELLDQSASSFASPSMTEQKAAKEVVNEIRVEPEPHVHDQINPEVAQPKPPQIAEPQPPEPKQQEKPIDESPAIDDSQEELFEEHEISDEELLKEPDFTEADVDDSEAERIVNGDVEDDFTLNERFKTQTQNIGQVIADGLLSKSLDINQKYEFVSGLFNNRSEQLAAVLKEIDSTSSLSETSELFRKKLIPQFGWEEDNPLLEKFRNLAKARFK